MLEDFRNHDPNPTQQERAWMATNPFAVVAKLVVVVGFAAVIGVSASYSLNPQQPPAVAATAR